jgi:hypothetical protein
MTKPSLESENQILWHIFARQSHLVFLKNQQDSFVPMYPRVNTQGNRHGLEASQRQIDPG